jgi:GT2 family glycosyltransferase
VISFREEATPDATVVIVALRDAPLLLTCLRSLAENVKQVSYEVIVVLNDPSPRLRVEVKHEVSGARFVPLRANLGFGEAVNHAARLARGRYLVLVNDDCTVTPDWLESLIDTVVRHPRCGLVGSRFLNPDGSLQEAGSVIWSDGTTAQVDEGEQPGYVECERRVDYSSGGSLLIRKDVWDRLGGFDGRYYPAYYEDVDLCLRAFEAGWEVRYQPLSVVYHALSASTTELERRFLVERARPIFADRWSDFLQRQEPKGDVEDAIRRAIDRPLPAKMTDEGVARIGEVESKPSESFDSAEPLELEIAALRRELEVRLAYNASMEQTILEMRRHIDWLHRHVENVIAGFDAEQKHAEELKAEQRRFADTQASLEVAEHALTTTKQTLEAIEQTLAEERGRASYIAVERLISRISDHPVLLGWLDRAARPFRNRRS